MFYSFSFIGLEKMTTKCGRCLGHDLYERYHDTERGVPVYDDVMLFEFLLLEGAQAGLNWFTVLKKREQYRNAFAGFDPTKVAEFDEEKIEALLQNPGIIRNRLKVRSAVKNACVFIEIQQEFGSFSEYFRGRTDGKQITNHWKTLAECPAVTPLSEKISKDLRKRGMSFVGSTSIYAFMQAVGMVNDHLITCFRWGEVGRLHTQEGYVRSEKFSD